MTQNGKTQAEPVELIGRDKPAELAEQQLAEATGGAFTFKLVAVKTISWARDDD
jgi:hypothetical protein